MDLTKNNLLKIFVIGVVFLLFSLVFWLNQNHVLAKNSELNEAKSKAAFEDAYKVFMSPRCVNCHPAGDVPTQGDAMTLHAQGVTRGKDGKGKGTLGDVYPPAADLTNAVYAGRGDGFFFHRITFGSALMPPYGHATSPQERWLIVKYVRKLQKAAP